MSKTPRVIYNFDPSFISSVPPRDGGYAQPITREYVESFVTEVAHRGVDAFFCCPSMLRRQLWLSKIDAHWEDEAPNLEEPPNPYNWEWDEKLYFRMRHHMLSGGKPIHELYEASRREGLSFFFTYRMNDCHYLEKTSSPILDKFWRDHPEFRINDYGGVHPNMHPQLVNLLQNYMYPEVRQHYLQILEELLVNFDVDGLEMDLMRKPCFVPLPQVEEGREVMTGFVRDVRNLLDRYGAERGKDLPLCVRVPHTVQSCYDLAMDIVRWDAEELVQMVNVSTSFLTNMFALDIRGFREELKNARVYGEMHGTVAYGKKYPNFGRRFLRQTTAQQYETTAYYLMNRGADGVSLWNFVSSRQHEFNDPRALAYPGTEPPLKALDHLGDREYLETCPKHYVINRMIVDGREYRVCAVPAQDDLVTEIELFEKELTKTYGDAVLRVETEDPSRHLPIASYINGHKLEQFEGTGELFPPVSIEGLASLENLRYFRVPVSVLRTGANVIEVHNEQRTHPKDFTTFVYIELALYPRGVTVGTE